MSHNNPLHLAGPLRPVVERILVAHPLGAVGMLVCRGIQAWGDHADRQTAFWELKRRLLAEGVSDAQSSNLARALLRR